MKYAIFLLFISSLCYGQNGLDVGGVKQNNCLNGGNAGAVVCGSNDNTTAIESNATTRLTFGTTGSITGSSIDDFTLTAGDDNIFGAVDLLLMSAGDTSSLTGTNYVKVGTGNTYANATESSDIYRIFNNAAEHFTLSATGVLTLTSSTVATGSVTTGMDYSMASTGATSDGFGFRTNWTLENGAGTQVEAVRMDAYFAETNAGAENSGIEFQTKNEGAFSTRLRVGNDYAHTVSNSNQYPLGGTISKSSTDVSNGGTTESDIFPTSTIANTLGATGESLSGTYYLNLTDVTATARIRVYFAGTLIGDTGALTVNSTGSVVVEVHVIRSGSTTAKAGVTISAPTTSTAVYTAQTDLTGLTFSGTNILNVTAQAGGAGGGNGDIVGKLFKLLWMP